MILRPCRQVSAWAFATFGGILWLALLGAGCPPSIPPDDPRVLRDDQLPDKLPALMAFAAKHWDRAQASKTFDYQAAANALAALRKANRKQPRTREVIRLGAEVARALSERARSPGAQLKFANQGLELTEVGRANFRDEVAFHYFHAALLGLKVDAHRAAAFSLVPEIRRAAKRAIGLDKTFDSAGPLRILGSLLTKVPSTAPFHGDVDEGIALLKEAVKLAPQYPLNHFFLAEAYAADDEHDSAAAHFAKVICAPTGKGWDRERASRYAGLSKKALSGLKRPSAPSCP